MQITTARGLHLRRARDCLSPVEPYVLRGVAERDRSSASRYIDRHADGGLEMGDEMQLRTFRDERDQEWEVRAIKPLPTDRRRRLIADDFANGWLLFTLGMERRRLASLPPGWHQASESQLVRWCADAEQVADPPHPDSEH